MITITDNLVSKNLLQVYFAEQELDSQLINEQNNPIAEGETAEHFCKFLKNYFRMEVPYQEVSQCDTTQELLEMMVQYLPQDKVILYYQLMTLYSVLLANAREERDNLIADID